MGHTECGGHRTRHKMNFISAIDARAYTHTQRQTRAQASVRRYGRTSTSTSLVNFCFLPGTMHAHGRKRTTSSTRTTSSLFETRIQAAALERVWSVISIWAFAFLSLLFAVKKAINLLVRRSFSFSSPSLSLEFVCVVWVRVPCVCVSLIEHTQTQK